MAASSDTLVEMAVRTVDEVAREANVLLSRLAVEVEPYMAFEAEIRAVSASGDCGRMLEPALERLNASLLIAVSGV
jgi:hypothetical protein